jgi:hypothetical protein
VRPGGVDIDAVLGEPPNVAQCTMPARSMPVSLQESDCEVVSDPALEV